MKPEELKKEFISKLWSLNKQGDADDIFNEVKFTIGYKTTIEGKVITIPLLVEKYKTYLKFMKSINADRDQKYKSKPMDIKEWLKKYKFNEDYSSTNNTELDDYLYGY